MYSGEYNWAPKTCLAPGIFYISMQQNGKKVAGCKLIKN
jgi:hypothetical protein